MPFHHLPHRSHILFEGPSRLRLILRKRKIIVLRTPKFVGVRVCRGGPSVCRGGRVCGCCRCGTGCGTDISPTPTTTANNHTSTSAHTVTSCSQPVSLLPSHVRDSLVDLNMTLIVTKRLTNSTHKLQNESYIYYQDTTRSSRLRLWECSCEFPHSLHALSVIVNRLLTLLLITSILRSHTPVAEGLIQ